MDTVIALPSLEGGGATARLLARIDELTAENTALKARIHAISHGPAACKLRETIAWSKIRTAQRERETEAFDAKKAVLTASLLRQTQDELSAANSRTLAAEAEVVRVVGYVAAQRHVLETALDDARLRIAKLQFEITEKGEA